MAGKHYQVTGEYVTVKTGTPDGVRVVGLYRGAPWPADASEEATKHHLTEGLIEEVGSPAPPPPPPPSAPAQPAAGGGRK